MDLFDFLCGAFKVGKYIYDETQSKKIEETEEFIAEVAEIENELVNINDYNLLYRFRDEYGDPPGRGLIAKHSHSGDSKYRAYMNVLRQRGFERVEARCDCGMYGFGFYMYPPESSDDYKLITESNLVEGIYYCKCGQKRWKIYPLEIEFHDF